MKNNSSQALLSSPVVISMAELAQLQDVVLWDVRHRLEDPHAGRELYRQRHLEGAVFVPFDEVCSAPPSAAAGRHPLPAVAAVAQALSRSGWRRGQTLVVYDDQIMFAARCVWLLQACGVSEARVLDGGYWPSQAAISTQEPQPVASPWPALHEPVGQCSPEVVDQLRQRIDWLLLDARSPERFLGHNETLDPVGGHIDGAHNRFWQLNLTPDLKLRDSDELRRAFLPWLWGRSSECVIHTCGSGVSATVNWLAMEHIGLKGSRLYPGSWSQWCQRS